MDINEKYDEEDIKDIEKLIREKINEDGVNTVFYDIIEVIANVSAQNVNKAYYDFEDEYEEYHLTLEDIVEEMESEDSLTRRIKALGIPLNEAVEIIINDDPIMEDIAYEIDRSVDYSNDYILAKKNNMDILSGAVLLLYNINAIVQQQNETDENDKCEQLKDVIKSKINEMGYADFIMLMSDYSGARIIAGDSYFEDALTDIINNMSPAEFAYYLRTINYQSGVASSIKEAERNKALASDSAYIEYIYNISRKRFRMLILKDDHNAFTIDTMELYKYDSIAIAIQDRKEKQKISDKDNSIHMDDITEEELIPMPEYQMYISSLKKLTKKEFVCFMLRNGNDYLYNEETKIMEQRLKELSRLDLIMLTKRLCSVELDCKVTSNTENEPLLIKVAKEQGILNENIELVCSEEELDLAEEKLYAYATITNGIAVPVVYDNESEMEDVNIGVENNQEEQEDNDNREDLSYEERKEYEYQKAEERINRMVKIHGELDKMSKMSNKEIIKNINEFNLFVNTEDSNSRLKNFTSYFSFRILSMPAIYTNAFRYKQDGCLEDIMEIKLDEFREDIESYRTNKGEDKNAKSSNGTSLKDIAKVIEEKRKQIKDDNEKNRRNTNNHGNQDR
jgi:hypothetical protein